jgi:hypothetical protein
MLNRAHQRFPLQRGRRFGLFLSALVLSVAMAGLAAEDSDDLASMVKKTDMQNVDSVDDLAEWCSAHDLPGKAHQYFLAAIHLDPDNERGRAGLGQIRLGEHWVSASQAKQAGYVPATAPSEASPIATGGKGPTADQVDWSGPAVPKDPTPDNPFLDAYIDKLPNIKNDSSDMDNAVATLTSPDNIKSGIPRICAALDKPDYGDLYGACDIVLQQQKAGDFKTVRVIVAHLGPAITHCSDPDDIAAWASVMGIVHDRRAVPRLILLLDNHDDNVRSNADMALAAITRLSSPVSKDKAQAWWDANHAVDDRTIFMRQMKSSDPEEQLGAIQALYDLHEPAMVPVMLKLLHNDDNHIRMQSVELLQKVTGRDWGLGPEVPKDARETKIGLIEKEYKSDPSHFWIESAADKQAEADQAATPAPAEVDPCPGWVKQLGSLTGTDADTAESNLIAKGNAAVPALIGGLEDQAPLIRRKANEVLKEITKHDVGYDSRGAPDARATAVAAWKTWCQGKGMMPVDGDDSATGDAAAPAMDH